MPTDDDYLNTNEVARMLNVHRATIARWVEQGALPSVVLPSGRRRYRRADVEATLQATTPVPPASEGGDAA